MRIKIIALLFVFSLAMLFPLGAAAADMCGNDNNSKRTVGTIDNKCIDSQAALVPTVVSELTYEIENQLNSQLGSSGGLSVIVTTPVNLNNLNESSPLGRQLAEEMSYQLTKTGYHVLEIRKGSSLVFEPGNGELLLTRDPNMLASTTASSSLILVGTYLVSKRSIRVNMKMLHTPTSEILAMSSKTIPLTRELRPLTSNMAMNRWGRTPTVGTRFN